MFLVLFLFLIGLAALIGGAKLLVVGASQLAATLGLSSLVIGLTVVAFGTSAPEIGISIVGAWKGEGALVVGNIIGSNLFNILLVLGVGATLAPLVVRMQLIRWDVPLMIIATLIFWAFTFSGYIGPIKGALLFFGIVLYLFFAFVLLKKTPSEESFSHPLPVWLQLTVILAGLILLAVGSELLITNASKIGRYLGISELLIGLTVVAVGTSLPELATTVIALQKGKSDLAVGNVIGSNLFNLLAVMGLAGIFSPEPIAVPQKAITFDIPILVGVSIATLPIFFTGHRISRWEGLLFLFYYLLYLIFLVIEGGYIAYLPYFTTAFLFFILPLTIITLIVGVVRHIKNG